MYSFIYSKLYQDIYFGFNAKIYKYVTGFKRWAPDNSYMYLLSNI